MIAAALLLATASPFPELAEALTSPDTGPALLYKVLHTEGDTTVEAVVNTTKDAGERIAVLSPPPGQWPDGLDAKIESFETDSDGEIWCDDADDTVGGRIEIVERSPNAIRFRFDPQPGADADKAERKFLARSQGLIDLARADEKTPWRVAGMTIELQKPFKPALVAKVTALKVEIQCAPDATGRMYKAVTTTTVQGSALGQPFGQNSVMRLSDVRSSSPKEPKP